MMTTTVRQRALSDEQAWAAVLGRDPRLDGRLFYGVSSTGVYCRPSCPSRRPRRHNATFFAEPAEAERAGYRPCLRCDPRGQRIDRPPAPVGKARAYLDLHFDQPIRLDALGREVGMSPHHLQRTFKRAYGVTPKEYQDALRLQRLKSELRAGGSVTTAIHEAGYGSGSRVYEKSDARLGMPPGAYRRGGQGMAIRYGIASTPLGRLLVGATDRGVCAVALGDDDAQLEAGLRAEYPLAGVERGAEELQRWLGTLVESISGADDLSSVPLDAQGTAFQQRVWDALRAIPSGETRSYAQVAVTIGRPSAARAVARACATNRVALVVPCHRVIGSKGRLSGYRWGAARKQALLDHEARRKG
jgi:AraC family transcriptional regulator, regulatory protein of adaptative response / methylated-DNA-[protein]-cysteine methyltransferase